MSARDDHPYLVWIAAGSKGYRTPEPGAAQRALAEIARLRAELDGLRVRTLTAETDADRLAELLEGATDDHRCRLDHDGFCQEHCSGGSDAFPRCLNAEAIEALAAHESARASSRVAGETGDTP